MLHEQIREVLVRIRNPAARAAFNDAVQAELNAALCGDDVIALAAIVNITEEEALEVIAYGVASRQLDEFIEQGATLTSKKHGNIGQELGYERINLDELIDSFESKEKMGSWLAAHPEFISGKSGKGFQAGHNAIGVELGPDSWRVQDLLSWDFSDAMEFKLDGMNITKEKQELGDGIFARVHPERLGLPAGTKKDAWQVRAFQNERLLGGVVCAFWKGIILIDPDQDETIGKWDGYGNLNYFRTTENLQLRVLAKASEMHLRARVGMQAIAYSGVSGWQYTFKHRECLNFDTRVGTKGSERLAALGLPAMFAPSTSLNKAAFALFEGATFVEAGLRLLALPAKLDRREFLAPRTSGIKVGDVRVIYRDPHMPNGTSVDEYQCVGHWDFNAFGLPTSQWQTDPHTKVGCWEFHAGDFDGDTAVAIPKGILQGFSARPENQQHALLAATEGLIGREKAKPYANARERWCGQVFAERLLGQLEIAARRLAESGRLEAAARFTPLIQKAVDRQKRDEQIDARLVKEMLSTSKGLTTRSLAVREVLGKGMEPEISTDNIRNIQYRLQALRSLLSEPMPAPTWDQLDMVTVGFSKVVEKAVTGIEQILALTEIKNGQEVLGSRKVPSKDFRAFHLVKPNATAARIDAEVALFGGRGELTAMDEYLKQIGRLLERVSSERANAIVAGLKTFEAWSALAPVDELIGFVGCVQTRNQQPSLGTLLELNLVSNDQVEQSLPED